MNLLSPIPSLAYLYIDDKARSLLTTYITTRRNTISYLIIEYNESSDLLDFTLVVDDPKRSDSILIGQLSSLNMYITSEAVRICQDRGYRGVTTDARTGHLTIVR